MEIKLTDDGKDLLLRTIAGLATLTFTGIQLGNGSNAGSSATALSNPLLTAELSSAVIDSNDPLIRLEASIANSEIVSGFRVKEIGVLAADPDHVGDTILYAYGYVAEENADYLAASSEYAMSMQLEVMVYIGEAENVSAQMSQSLSYVSRGDFDNHLSDQTNPHGVTKAQVGLGNVPNVATNDQTPTYTIPAAPDALVSGEKLSVAIGKIAAAVRSVIAHLADFHNPHQVTAAQAGAAKAAHDHSASDITSGVLGATRGGTGYSSIASFRIALMKPVFPVGSVYATNNLVTSPQNILGFGTWTRIGTVIGGGDAEIQAIGGGSSSSTIYFWQRTA